MAVLLEVRTTFADPALANEVARILVAERLAACVQLVPGMTSIHSWQGMLRHEQEILCLIKTTADGWPALRDRLITLHPYETPEILAVPVEHGSFEYVSWVRENVAT